ncbi:IS1182 family transposase [Devosia elaeis]|uniref:Transposase n=1 Tax=Devosia elaeis TaxID=1770058 RepID=A0A178HMW5_9HYPH|nr:IS1182 family transposase [Devosia elaeis]OAM73415.1 transposase [Devosia elaeis]
MGRFVEGTDRDQASFLPARLEDYVFPDNPVRVIDAFVEELDLAELGFARVQPAATGRPGYAPGTMLKLYVYGYLHQLTSSRKLEREAGRNIELMWLIGKLVPDFKTIADFRHDNGGAIQVACQRFVAICRALGLVGGSMVAIDGSRLRAVNTHEKNYTNGKLARRKAHVEESIARYLVELEEADSAGAGPAAPRIEHLTERLASLRGRLGELEEIGQQLEAAPDEQISLTDPDARAMATGSDHRGVVGYNVQAAVDTKHHIVVANEVTNRGHDRSHLLEMAKAAQAETGAVGMIALADRGYYEGEQIRSCAEAGIIPMVPKPNTSPAAARGFWGKTMFVHEPETDTYRCPAGQQLQKRFARVEGGKLIGVYFNQKACGACASRPLCTAGKEKRIRRWEHEAVLDQMERRFDTMPEAMAVRRCTVEHVFGTIKGWMGATHFRTRGLRNVATEASLTILAYNIKRAIAVAGVASTLKAITR